MFKSKLVERWKGQKGFVLITAALSTVVLIGVTGLSFDAGRLYIAKSELQAFVDAASLSAAQQLDGTSDGTTKATNAALDTRNAWNFNTQSIQSQNVRVEFSQPPVGTGYNWVQSPNPADNYTFARVQARVQAPVYFIRTLFPHDSTSVAAEAIAGQMPKTSFKDGLFPFSPYAHLFNIGNGMPCGASARRGCTDETTGLVVGNVYTLRWPANPTTGQGVSGNSNMCPGDRSAGQTIIDIANAAGGSERGYIESTSADDIRETITDDLQTVDRTVGELVTMTGGAKQTQWDALLSRISQDVNSSATNSEAYFAAPHNNRRVVACLINDGVLVGSNQYRSVQIGGFLLFPASSYGVGGNQAWCAEYLGSYVKGGKTAGAGAPGAYVVRLVQ
ncbi:MAG: pilus assembly protein [Acidobacteria bacterium]|nr:pilus assembly protein [Acidobacteriota bacterium]